MESGLVHKYNWDYTLFHFKFAAEALLTIRTWRASEKSRQRFTKSLRRKWPVCSLGLLMISPRPYSSIHLYSIVMSIGKLITEGGIFLRKNGVAGCSIKNNRYLYVNFAYLLESRQTRKIFTNVKSLISFEYLAIVKVGRSSTRSLCSSTNFWIVKMSSLWLVCWKLAEINCMFFQHWTWRSKGDRS